MDISEQCNKSLEEQIELFNSIKPLFVNKPIMICLNKVDILSIDDLSEDRKALFKAFEDEGNGVFYYCCCCYYYYVRFSLVK